MEGSVLVGELQASPSPHKEEASRGEVDLPGEDASPGELDILGALDLLGEETSFSELEAKVTGVFEMLEAGAADPAVGNDTTDAEEKEKEMKRDIKEKRRVEFIVPQHEVDFILSYELHPEPMPEIYVPESIEKQSPGFTACLVALRADMNLMEEMNRQYMIDQQKEYRQQIEAKGYVSFEIMSSEYEESEYEDDEDESEYDEDESEYDEDEAEAEADSDAGGIQKTN